MNVQTYLTFEHTTGETVTGALAWSETDPFAVTIKFDPPDQDPIVWHVYRDLMFLGLADRAGLGDVRVRRISPTLVRFTLESPTGYCQMTTSAFDLGNFLAQTYDLVPRGSEMDRIDLDAELAALLDGAL